MLEMRSAKACFLLAIGIALSIESVHGIQCYECYGPQCANPSIKNCSSGACFLGSGLILGTRYPGKVCAAAVGSNCVNTTCKTISAELKAARGVQLTNCNGTCCEENLCNGPSPSTLPATLSTSTNNQSTPTTESTKPTGTESTKPTVSGTMNKESNMFVACALVWIVLVYNK